MDSDKDDRGGDTADLFVNENHISPLENDLPTLYITSYGRCLGPLEHTPHLLFDLRSLPNPPKAARTGHTGLSKTLRDSLFANPVVQQRFEDVCNQIRRAISDAERDGQRELLIGVFCELGKHRSVSFVEELARTKFDGWNVVADHRDVHRKRSSRKSRRTGAEQNESDE